VVYLLILGVGPRLIKIAYMLNGFYVIFYIGKSVLLRAGVPNTLGSQQAPKTSPPSQVGLFVAETNPTWSFCRRSYSHQHLLLGVPCPTSGVNWLCFGVLHLVFGVLQLVFDVRVFVR
jgi:hypothetical protein